MVTIPDRLYAEMADMVMLSWQEMALGEMMLQMELQFAGALDADRLARALQLVLDAQPVLGSRVVMAPKRPYWQRLYGDERKNLSVTTAPDEYEKFKLRNIDHFTEPQLMACLLRGGCGGDRLLLKVSHNVADAGGAKEVGADVASIYTRLGTEPGFTPEPNLSGSRDWMQIYRLVPWHAYPKIFLNFLRDSWSISVPTVSRTFEPPVGPRLPLCFVLKHLSTARVAALSEYGRARGASLNDMFISAHLRAIAANGGPDARGRLRMQMTVDLRRWHLNGARAGGICNLSAFEYPNIGYEPGRDFDETLARVSTFMRRRKADMPGLSQAPFLPLYYRLSYQGLLKFFRVVIGAMIRKHNFMNVLTNMGPILPELVTFGDMTPTDAWLLVPPIYPPLFGAGLTGYAGTLTLSAGVPESARPAVDAFYDSVLSELPG